MGKAPRAQGVIRDKLDASIVPRSPTTHYRAVSTVEPRETPSCPNPNAQRHLCECRQVIQCSVRRKSSVPLRGIPCHMIAEVPWSISRASQIHILALQPCSHKLGESFNDFFHKPRASKQGTSYVFSDNTGYPVYVRETAPYVEV